MNGLKRFVFPAAAILLLGWSAPVLAQANSRAAFVAYQCTFQTATNSAQVRAVLMGSDGLPIPREAYTVSVSVAGTDQVLPGERVTAAFVPVRPPLQMIIVLDITDTVPIPQIVNAVSNRLAPQLDAQDRVALITFGEEIAPSTQFFTDKNRLINEHMIDLQPQPGDNRLYDALLRAVSEFPLASDGRKVVVALTDSGRRKLEQASIEEIIGKASRDKVQVYPIGFYTRDRPDDLELVAIANGSGGYAWLYTEIENTRASIEGAVTGFLDSLVRTLNSEILVTVNMQGIQPDPNGRVPLAVSINSENEAPLADQISCPFQQLHHEIRFTDDIRDMAVKDKVDIAATVNSDLSLDELQIVFRQNDEIVQNSASAIYTFDAAGVAPGYYTIGAQLWDRSNNTLATTPTAIQLYAQQTLQLRTASAETTDLSGAVAFEVTANPAFTLPGVKLTITPVSTPGQVYDLGTALFEAGGRAVLTLDSIQQTVADLFPNLESGAQLRVSAFVPGISPGDPFLAYSDDLLITIAPPAPRVPLRLDRTLPLLITVFFLALNLLLFRMVGRRKILKIINNPDDYELSPQLMTLTVRRGELTQPFTLTRKTVFIGRGSANDINLGDDPNISRQHGVVMWRKQGWYYSNRKGQAVARINGRRFRGFTFRELTPVTEIEIGGALLIFHSNAQQDISDFIKTNL